MLANENAKKNKGVAWRGRDPQTPCIHFGAQLGRYHGAGAKVRKTITSHQTKITASRSDFRGRLLLQNARPHRPRRSPLRMKPNPTTCRERRVFYFRSLSSSCGRSGRRVAPRRSRTPRSSGDCRRHRLTASGSAAGGTARAARGGGVTPAPGNPSEPWKE